MTGLKLAGEFAGADREAWARQAIAGLKGRPLEGLTSRTYDGIVVEPVVPRAEAPAPLPAHGRGWQTMQRIDMPDFGAANGQALEDLENGADGLCLVWPESLAAGRHGVPVTGPREMARLFEGVHLDLIRLRLDAGRFGRPAAALVAEFYEARSVDPARARLSLCLDPVGAFALMGKLIDPQALAERMAETLRRLDGAGHRGDVFAADARVWHGAGASEAQELGLALASLIQYLRLLEAGGIEPEVALLRMAMVLAADADQFLTIAKFRAARVLWARLAETLGTERCCTCAARRDIVAHDDQARCAIEPVAHHHRRLCRRYRRGGHGDGFALHRRPRPCRSLRAAHGAQHPVDPQGGIRDRRGERSGRRIGPSGGPDPGAGGKGLGDFPRSREGRRADRGTHRRQGAGDDRRRGRKARQGHRAAQGRPDGPERIPRSRREEGGRTARWTSPPTGPRARASTSRGRRSKCVSCAPLGQASLGVAFEALARQGRRDG